MLKISGGCGQRIAQLHFSSLLSGMRRQEDIWYLRRLVKNDLRWIFALFLKIAAAFIAVSTHIDAIMTALRRTAEY